MKKIGLILGIILLVILAGCISDSQNPVETTVLKKFPADILKDLKKALVTLNAIKWL